MADGIVKVLALLEGIRRGRAFRASLPLEGNAAHMDRAEGLWWAYKFYWRPVEAAEAGSGLEAHFAAQDLDFTGGAEGKADPPGTATFTLGAGGDILVSPDLDASSLAHFWDKVGPFLFSADLACANLETPVSPSAPPGFLPASILGPMALNSTPEAFDAIRGRSPEGPGIGLFSTANNHCLDQGEAGLRETLDFLDGRGCLHVGTARSPEEARKVILVEGQGITVAFISWTFALNWKSLPEGKEYLANHLRLNLPGVDLGPIRSQVAEARAAGADVVVACLHWSLEFESYPTRHLVALGHHLVELGVDLILGNHPHGVQPLERHAYADPVTGEAKEGLILYAMGDLVTVRDRVLPNSHLGLLARVTFAKTSGDAGTRTRISRLEVLPTYLFPRFVKGRCVDFRLLDLRRLGADLGASRSRDGLSRRQARDIPRLLALMSKVLGPAL